MPRVLIVDDSPTMRKMVQSALRPLHPECREASNGLEALEQLALDSCDLMILDLNMPDMHGLEVIQYARRHDAYRRLPILVLTTRTEDETRERVLQAGADRYCTKPFQPQALVSAVEELLGAAQGPQE